MADRDKRQDEEQRPTNDSTKPANQDVGPPEERVDDEADGEDRKTTKRQE